MLTITNYRAEESGPSFRSGVFSAKLLCRGKRGSLLRRKLLPQICNPSVVSNQFTFIQPYINNRRKRLKTFSAPSVAAQPAEEAHSFYYKPDFRSSTWIINIYVIKALSA